jgi:PPE-repeat protein
VLDFGALPPEINSARIYAGPGSGPLMAAASAWNSVAGELNSAATGYGAVVTRLASEEWMGPASASMAQAATPYVTWMSSTAAQAEQAATQASAAAGAYETAFAAHVPPPLIAANRAQLAQAVSTNVLGQNTPVISQLEAQYGEMWAQDAAAMYNYAGQAATATRVTQFDPPVTTTTPAAQAVQSAAVTNAANTAASSTSSQSVLSGLTSQLPSSLQSLATPTASSASSALTDPLTEIWFLLSGQTTLPTNLGTFLSGYANYASFFYNTEGLPYFSVGMANSGVQMAKSLGVVGGAAPAAAGGAAQGAAGAAGGLGGLGGLGGGGPVAAGIGNAGSVGRLSVPPAWGGASAALPATSAPMPISSVAAAPEATGGAGNLLGGMPLAGAGAGAPGSAPRYGFRPTVMARPPFAG